MKDPGPIYYNSNDGFKRRCIGTEFKFVWFPKKCHFTGKVLWLQNAYKQTSMLTGPGDPIFEYRYYDKNEFLVARIKGEV
jgi:hypothetical protein